MWGANDKVEKYWRYVLRPNTWICGLSTVRFCDPNSDFRFWLNYYFRWTRCFECPKCWIESKISLKWRLTNGKPILFHLNMFVLVFPSVKRVYDPPFLLEYYGFWCHLTDSVSRLSMLPTIQPKTLESASWRKRFLSSTSKSIKQKLKMR